MSFITFQQISDGWVTVDGTAGVKLTYNNGVSPDGQTNFGQLNQNQIQKFSSANGCPSLDQPLMVDNMQVQGSQYLNGIGAVLPPSTYFNIQMRFGTSLGFQFNIKTSPAGSVISDNLYRVNTDASQTNDYIYGGQYSFYSPGSAQNGQALEILDAQLQKPNQPVNIQDMNLITKSYQLNIEMTPVKSYKDHNGNTHSWNPSPGAQAESFLAVDSSMLFAADTETQKVNVHPGGINPNTPQSGQSYGQPIHDIVLDTANSKSVILALVVLNAKYYSSENYKFFLDNHGKLND